MSWLALELEIEGAVAEPFSEALLELGADSVTIEEAQPSREAGPREEAALVRHWERSRIGAIVSPDTDPASLVRNAARAAGLSASPSFAVHSIRAEDWVRRTQSQFGPMQIGEHLWVVPSWCTPPSNEDEVVLRLDPGLAFGTGSHPTTRLVLTWLERHWSEFGGGGEASGASVLDYGCGSGILALAAAKLGAAEAVATDNDPQALRTCAENAETNGLPIVVVSPQQLGERQFDVILANILARPLIELAPTLAAHAKRGARLALSGILEEQVEEVLAAYAGLFKIALAGTSEGWALVVGVRQ